MPSKTAAYARLRWKASKGFAIKRDLVIAALTAIIGWFVLDRKSAVDNAVSVLGLGLGAVILVEIISVAYRFVWSTPFAMHEADQQQIVKLESERDEARREAAARRQNRALADRLTTLRTRGLHEIRNDYESNHAQLSVYLQREREWREEVEQAMREGGCTHSEISSVMDITNSEIGLAAVGGFGYGPQGAWLIGIMEMRIRRLSDVIERLT